MTLNKAILTPVAIGTIAALALGFIMAAPAGGLVVMAGYGAAIGALVSLQVRHWVPFKFKRTLPAVPRPTVVDDSVAREDGSKITNTKLAKLGAVVLGIAIVALFVFVIATSGDASWSTIRPL